MNQPFTEVSEPVSDPNESAPLSLDGNSETMEQRIKRLEDALASLQDTRQLEERVVERVAQKVQSEPVPVPAPAKKTWGRFFDAKKHPEAGDKVQDHTEKLISASTGVSPHVVRHGWLLFDIFTEFRTILSMFFDIRYHMGWLTRWTVIVLFALIMTSHLWFPFAHVPVIGPLIDKLVDLVLAFIMIKTLIREAQRYRERQGIPT
jgi:hypothetical protein